MTVFIVYLDYIYPEIIGVYSSMEKAEKARMKCIEDEFYDYLSEDMILLEEHHVE